MKDIAEIAGQMANLYGEREKLEKQLYDMREINKKVLELVQNITFFSGSAKDWHKAIDLLKQTLEK